MSLNQGSMTKNGSVVKGAAERCDKAAAEAGQGYAPSTSYDEQLNVVISKPLSVQRATIRHITKTEPGLSEAVVTGQLVHKLLKRAGRLSIHKRNAAICRVLELDPALDRAQAITKLNQLAMDALQSWATVAFWNREIDPLLCVGLTNATQEFEAAVQRISSLHPALTVRQIAERHTQYCRQFESTLNNVRLLHPELTRWQILDRQLQHCSERRNCITKLPGHEWSLEADHVLREAVVLEATSKSEAIQRAATRHREVRLKAIERRMALIERRFAGSSHRYERFSWSSELDARLLEAKKADCLRRVVGEIAVEYGRSRAAVYKHCDRLGIPRQKRPAVETWTAADLRYLTDYATLQSVSGMAEALGRTRWAVIRKVQQFGLDVAVSRPSLGIYSLREIREALHKGHRTIVRWIARGTLKLSVTGKNVKKGSPHHVQEEDLIRCLEENLAELDITRINPSSRIRLLVDDILAGRPQSKRAAKK